MNSGIPSASVYHDLQGLARLRHKAGADAQGSLREVAQQFEALFINMMLKSMRDASLGDSLFDSEQGEFYRDMYDQQLSVTLAQRHGIGLADVLVRQLGGQEAEPDARTVKTLDHYLARMRAERAAAPSPQQATSSAGAGNERFATPGEFVEAIWPHACVAARELGTDPRVIVAQAALETGWGKAVLRRADGGSSHNLFNIKADGRWSGERVHVAALEYEGGVPVLRREAFRSYPSLAEAFQDYVQFLRSSPRYAEALRSGADAQRYSVALQRAGYATDPEYASKINGIVDGELLQGALTGIKNSSGWTISGTEG